VNIGNVKKIKIEHYGMEIPVWTKKRILGEAGKSKLVKMET
jgi:hypothetical protein